MRRSLVLVSLFALGCGGAPSATTPATPPAAPCYTIRDSELRPKDAQKTLDELTEHIRLATEDEALREPKSLGDVRKILRRDSVYLFAAGAKLAREQNTREGRFTEAALELALGESQLVASQVLGAQVAWVGTDLRTARAALASEGGEPSTDRGRMLAQLVRVVEEGNKIADALGVVAPSHLTRGAEVIRVLRKEAPADLRTSLLLAEYHRLRGEWAEFDMAMKIVEAADRTTPVLCYLKAMEQVERHRQIEQGATMMRDCLKRYPRFVRAQVALVMMARGPVEGLREIEALRRMNEDHYLVMLLEPTLAAEKELARMQSSGTNAPPR